MRNSTSLVVERGKRQKLMLEANANPPPLEKQIRVFRCVTKDSCHPLSEPAKVRVEPAKPKKEQPKYSLEVDFLPKISGSYAVDFKSDLVSQKSSAFYVEVICE